MKLSFFVSSNFNRDAYLKSRTAIFLLIAITSIPLFAKEYYLAVDGSDRNDGSISKPWATVMHAVNFSVPGDSILLRGGTYPVQEEIWIIGSYGHGGQPGKMKTIMAYPGEAPYISQRFLVDADYVRVKGLNFSNGAGLNAVEWDSPTSHVEFLENNFYGRFNVYSGAINYKGSYGLIEGNRLELEDTGSTNDHGIYVLSGSNTMVRNNYISGAPAYGIHIYDEDNGYTPHISDVTVENNTVIGSFHRSGIIVSIKPSSDQSVRVQNVTIRNNILVNNYQSGIALGDGRLRNIKIYNNVFYNNKTGISIFASNIDSLNIINNSFSSNQSYHIDNTSDINDLVVTNNLYFDPEFAGSHINDAKPVFDDPGFVDPSHLDFHLLATSHAIDAGIDVGIPYNGNAPDIGAFEFEGTPTRITTLSTLIPGGFSLHQNFPNPFNPITTIIYEIAEPCRVKIRVFDTMGAVVKILFDGAAAPGIYALTWDGTDKNGVKLASGIYFYAMQANPEKGIRKFAASKKLVLLQ